MELITTAMYASVEAGMEIMKVFKNGIKISIKRNLTPVTNADKISNEIIVNSLTPFNIPIISEETKLLPYSERSSWKTFWLIDPLDGTKEFISRRNDFTVNIALIKENIPSIGVIYAPAYDTLYYSETGTGAFRMDNASEKLEIFTKLDNAISQSIKLPDKRTEKYTFIVSRSHINNKTKNYLKSRSVNKDCHFISVGSSLKFCALAEGKADEYPRFGPTMEWDIAAGDAILQHTGGITINALDGTIMQYNKPNLLNPDFIAFRVSN